MNLKNWLNYFWTTLVVGTAATLLTAMAMLLLDPTYRAMEADGLLYNMMQMIFLGMTFSVLAQMGFFAYLTFNYIFQGMFRRRSTWELIQWFLTAVALGDLIFLKVISQEDADSRLFFSILIAGLLLLTAATAFYKTKLTNKTAFTPAFFFVFVGTVLESVPALRENTVESVLIMLIPILVCNAWLILRLHKWVKPARAAEQKAEG